MLSVARSGRVVSPIVLFSSSRLRSFSSLPKDLSLYQKLQKWMQPFVAGSKGLYLENKQAWALRRRVQESNGQAKLTRREMLLLRQAHRDLLKSIPLLAFFCVPILGYMAPLLGYQFPKQLLPWQFWRADQKTQFLRQDAEDRAKTYPDLMQLLLQIQPKKDFGVQVKTNLRPAQVTELVPFFQGPAALEQLSRQHLDLLAQGVAIFPTFAVLNKLLMPSQLQKKLNWRMAEIRVDDGLLLKEGVDDLSLSELEFACQERGIVTQYGEIEALRDALKEWLSMYDTDHFDPAFNPQRLPSSLLLHASALADFDKLEENTSV